MHQLKVFLATIYISQLYKPFLCCGCIVFRFFFFTVQNLQYPPLVHCLFFEFVLIHIMPKFKAICNLSAQLFNLHTDQTQILKKSLQFKRYQVQEHAVLEESSTVDSYLRVLKFIYRIQRGEITLQSIKIVDQMFKDTGTMIIRKM